MHKCNICGKEFETSQKLGGHKSSHGRSEEYSVKRRKKDPDYYIQKERRRNFATSKCDYCEKEFDKKSIGAHVILCKDNPLREKTLEKISDAMKGKKMSIDAKEKISNSMKEAHYNGLAWNIGRSRWNNSKSYPEKFFENVIRNEFQNKLYKSEYPIGNYSIDFAWVDIKKGIEIDGEQHERFDDYMKRDIRKDAYCKSLGWEILRIKWKDLYNDTKNEIKKAKEFIHGRVV